MSMETLEELKEKYNNLNKERITIYNKIVDLEQQEINNKFIVGKCYLNTCRNSFMKIISIDKQVLHCIVVEWNFIKRDYYYLCDTAPWKKITSEQFKDIYLAVIRDIQDPDLKDGKESNWDVTLKSVIDSINKEK